jgi:hypothetical protein
MKTTSTNIMPLRSTRTTILGGLLAMVVGVTTGCGSDPFTDEGVVVERTGTLTAALSTTGPDGATYKFVNNTRLNIYTAVNSRGASYGIVAPIDGAETVFTKRLPVGTYTLGLTQSNGLERTLNGVTTVVAAEWLDPPDATFDVVENQTIPVVLHFRVTGIGDITFAMGSVAVTLDVEQTTTTNVSKAREGGNITVTSERFADPAASYVAPLTMTTGTSHPQAVTVSLSGSWENRLGLSVCRPATIASYSWAATDQALRLRLEQVAAGDGELCFNDNGAADYFSLHVTRLGPAPADQTSFLPEASYFAVLNITGVVGDVFDGVTLRQSALADGVTVSNGSFTHTLQQPGAPIAVTSLIATFNGSFSLLP